MVKIKQTGDIETMTTITPANQVVESPISKLSLDFGREDLNLLATKINELIDNYNG